VVASGFSVTPAGKSFNYTLRPPPLDTSKIIAIARGRGVMGNYSGGATFLNDSVVKFASWAAGTPMSYIILEINRNK
jgi:hypothetical protein